MKRFAVFIGMLYYPSGGWNDFHSSFDDLEEATSAMREEVARRDDFGPWGQIVDLTSGEAHTFDFDD